MINEIIHVGGEDGTLFVSDTGQNYRISMEELDEILKIYMDKTRKGVWNDMTDPYRFNNLNLIAKETEEYICDLKIEDDAVERLMEIGLLKLLEDKVYNSAKIERIHFNDPFTVVIFNDGEKVIVKTTEDDVYDPRTGVAMAIVTHIFGTRSQFRKFVDKEYNKDIKNKVGKSIKKRTKAIHKILEEWNEMGEERKGQVTMDEFVNSHLETKSKVKENWEESPDPF